VPLAVVEAAWSLPFLSDAYVRLLIDERMKYVWTTLMRRKRTPGRPYESPAAKGQCRGLQDLFILAGGYSSTYGLRSAISAKELEAAKEPYLQVKLHLQNALRGLQQLNIGRRDELFVLQRLINECESTAANFSHLGLTIVDRESGDMFLRSYLAELTKFMRETFGSPHYGIVARIANVVHDRKDVTIQQVREAARDKKERVDFV
jgi:hypothetical protein